jgi:hypothetical protein
VRMSASNKTKRWFCKGSRMMLLALIREEAVYDQAVTR